MMWTIFSPDTSGWDGIPVPLVALSKGFLSTTKVDAEFKGVSAHAGMSPQDGKNAILAACSATLAMHTACQDSRGAPGSTSERSRAEADGMWSRQDAMIRFETRGETARYSGPCP